MVFMHNKKNYPSYVMHQKVSWDIIKALPDDFLDDIAEL